MADASLSASKNYQAEIVSPILHYEDIAELQEIVRAVRAAGAKSHESAGIHIHVDAARFDARAVTNLVKIFHKQEALIQHALGSPEPAQHLLQEHRSELPYAPRA